MRIIFNIHSSRIARFSGWRARAVNVNDKSEARLDEALRATLLEDGSSIYSHIIGEGCIRDEWILIVNGITVTDKSSLKMSIKDNVQIHLLSNPHVGRKIT